MLNNKKSYRGISVEVFGTGYKSLDGKTFKIVDQFPSDRDGLIFDLNVIHPKTKNGCFSISENQCKLN